MPKEIYMKIDISRAKETLDSLRAVHTEREFRNIVYSAFKQTGKFTRTRVKRAIPLDYEVTEKEVYKRIGMAKTTIGGGGIGVSCCIPIKGTRLSIGGGFPAAGGAPGWSAKGKRYKISAQITKQKASILPDAMEHQGGYPPFINTAAPDLNGVAFTRTGKKTKDGKDAIAKVVGIAVPQMAINRSEDRIQKAVADKLIERLEHEHKWRIEKCRR